MIIDLVDENGNPLCEISGGSIPEIGDEIFLEISKSDGANYTVLKKRFYCDGGLAQEQRLYRVRIYLRENA